MKVGFEGQFVSLIRRRFQEPDRHFRGRLVEVPLRLRERLVGVDAWLVSRNRPSNEVRYWAYGSAFSRSSAIVCSAFHVRQFS